MPARHNYTRDIMHSCNVRISSGHRAACTSTKIEERTGVSLMGPLERCLGAGLLLKKVLEQLRQQPDGC